MQRVLRIIFVLCFIALPLTVGVALYVLIGFHADRADLPDFSQQTAVWMAHHWVSTDWTTDELEALSRQIEDLSIDTLYVHTGPLNSSGGIEGELYAGASDFVATIRQSHPELEVYTWLGQLRSKLDLDDPTVRAEIIRTGESLVVEEGFDGIHYDIEPIYPGDTGFLALLEETKATLPNIPVSIATNEWLPTPLVATIESLFNTDIVAYWTTADFEAALPHIDQLVIMGYNTGLPTTDWYQWLLEQQVITLTNLIEDVSPGTEFYLGLPTYDTPEGQTGFDATIENLTSGLAGTWQGLTNTRTALEHFTGIALYAYWTTDEEEWAHLEEEWTP